MSRSSTLSACMLLVLLGSGIVASLGAVEECAKTGIFTLTFSERSPESAYERIAARYGWKPTPEKEQVYAISEEPFDVNVPADYDGSVPYGLIVHTDAGSTGNPYVYKDVLGPHKVIWIGATKVSNDRDVACRWGLALDAVHNMTKRYRIDPKRIYACGMSGGGRCASMIAPTYADVFTGGGIYLVGCNPFMFPDEKKIGKPIRELAHSHRFALMTGTNDMNRDGTKSVFEAYKADGFKHVEYFETPGMGHEFPPADWFSKGLDSVDAPLLAEAQQLLAIAQALEKKNKLLDAFNAYDQAATCYPLATKVAEEAKPKADAMRTLQDALLQPEFAKLQSNPNADKLREFAAKWAAFPVGTQAHAQANGLADKQLETLVAAGGTSLPDKIGKFLVTWKGYAVRERAALEYDKLAAVDLAITEGITDSDKKDKALMKFLSSWTLGASVERARTALESDLSQKLAVITAIEKPALRAPKLAAFAKAWHGSETAAKAEHQLAELSAPAKGQ